jgi:monoamine oxidase
MTEASQRKKVVVVGAGWAGLGATYHLARQGYDVTLLEAGSYPGGLVAGWKTPGGRSVEAGIHGFWYPCELLVLHKAHRGIVSFIPRLWRTEQITSMPCARCDEIS